MAERLRRLEIVFSKTPVYFVTACTHVRRPILANESVQRRLHQFGDEGVARGAWVGDYVLMPDHVHLFVALDAARISLSRWIKAFKGSLSQTLAAEKIAPPYWQKGAFDHILRSAESYSSKWEYIRNNPVRAGLVETAEDWKFAGRIVSLNFPA